MQYVRFRCCCIRFCRRSTVYVVALSFNADLCAASSPYAISVCCLLPLCVTYSASAVLLLRVVLTDSLRCRR